MNIKNYQSGTYKQQYQYQSFSPVKINYTLTCDNPQINVMLGDAPEASMAVTILRSS